MLIPFTLCLFLCLLQGSHAYRDRAAERRALRGGFGLGPGQKNAGSDHDNDPTCIEDAKAEALNMSFGADSYARRIMEGMGWKEVSVDLITCGT